MSWIPFGAKPAGIVLSVNELTSLKLPSYMSTLLFALSAANRKFPEALLVIANPVYTAPEFVAAMMALLGSDCGAHPLMVPSRVAKRKIEAHPCTWNSFEPFHTIPVGEPAPEPLAEGISTSKGILLPPPVYSVDQPEP